MDPDYKTGAAEALSADNTSAHVIHLDHLADGRQQDCERSFQPPQILRNLTSDELARLEAKLLRKIDFRILPMILVMYILNYLDRSVAWMSGTPSVLTPNRNNIASARFAGLEDDLGLNASGTQFSVC